MYVKCNESNNGFFAQKKRMLICMCNVNFYTIPEDVIACRSLVSCFFFQVDCLFVSFKKKINSKAVKKIKCFGFFSKARGKTTQQKNRSNQKKNDNMRRGNPIHR